MHHIPNVPPCRWHGQKADVSTPSVRGNFVSFPSNNLCRWACLMSWASAYFGPPTYKMESIWWTTWSQQKYVTLKRAAASGWQNLHCTWAWQNCPISSNSRPKQLATMMKLWNLVQCTCSMCTGKEPQTWSQVFHNADQNLYLQLLFPCNS